MRQELLDLINKSIIHQYDLPNESKGILRTIYSTECDKCYLAKDQESIATIIYNSILEYSFNEFELEEKDFQAMHSVALQSKLKYDADADESEKIKYGFFGEVMLYSILAVLFKAKPLIARGYFYNPLENSETKGYDSYQLIDHNGRPELWFGEVKFHMSHSNGLKSVFDNIEKALCDKYFKTNIIALHSHKNNFNITGSIIDEILKSWEENPEINIIDEAKKYNIKLVYPILLLYEEHSLGYDESIKQIPAHIVEKFSGKKLSLSIDYSVFFILMPLKEVRATKKKVLEWIESKKQLL